MHPFWYLNLIAILQCIIDFIVFYIWNDNFLLTMIKIELFLRWVFRTDWTFGVKRMLFCQLSFFQSVSYFLLQRDLIHFWFWSFYVRIKFRWNSVWKQTHDDLSAVSLICIHKLDMHEKQGWVWLNKMINSQWTIRKMNGLRYLMLEQNVKKWS